VLSARICAGAYTQEGQCCTVTQQVKDQVGNQTALMWFATRQLVALQRDCQRSQLALAFSTTPYTLPFYKHAHCQEPTASLI
jgi:hypothetical protein